MATYQVRIDADGQKVLSEPLSGLGDGLATSEAPGVVRPDGKTVHVDNTGLLSAIGGNLLLNSEEWITESGTWAAPVTGWYNIMAIDGGGGGHIDTAKTSAQGGASGVYKFATVYLEAGQSLDITIGSGGIGRAAVAGSYDGGVTTVGGVDFSHWTYANFISDIHTKGGNSTLDAHCTGAGLGGARLGIHDGHWYGAGGGAIIENNNTVLQAHNGHQGVVVFRWHDPAKAAGPAE